jgi:hypothetical protein
MACTLLGTLSCSCPEDTGSTWCGQRARTCRFGTQDKSKMPKDERTCLLCNRCTQAHRPLTGCVLLASIFRARTPCIRLDLGHPPYRCCSCTVLTSAVCSLIQSQKIVRINHKRLCERAVSESSSSSEHGRDGEEAGTYPKKPRGQARQLRMDAVLSPSTSPNLPVGHSIWQSFMVEDP